MRLQAVLLSDVIIRSGRVGVPSPGSLAQSMAATLTTTVDSSPTSLLLVSHGLFGFLQLCSTYLRIADSAGKGGWTQSGVAVGGYGILGGGSATSGGTGSSNGGDVNNDGGVIFNGLSSSTDSPIFSFLYHNSFLPFRPSWKWWYCTQRCSYWR